MQALDIIIEDSRWTQVGIDRITQQAIAQTLSHLTLDPAACEVSVLACDDAKIATLNADFRGKPTPTNVLSWPSEERAAMRDGEAPQVPQPDPSGLIALGDIAISYDTCAVEAQAAGKPISAHAIHLLVHGTLHLLGYDHIRDADGDLMEALEVEILGKLGQDNPYLTDTAHPAGEP